MVNPYGDIYDELLKCSKRIIKNVILEYEYLCPDGTAKRYSVCVDYLIRDDIFKEIFEITPKMVDDTGARYYCPLFVRNNIIMLNKNGSVSLSKDIKNLFYQLLF